MAGHTNEALAVGPLKIQNCVFWQREVAKGKHVDQRVWDGIDAETPKEITDMVFHLKLAKMYNHYTGSNITHKDVEDWGFLEMAIIMYSFDVLTVAK